MRLGRPQRRSADAESSAGLQARATLHLHRYAPFYVFAVAGLLIVSLLPTVDQGERGLFTGSGSGAGSGLASGTGVGSQPDGAADGSTAGTPGAGAAPAAAGPGNRGADKPAAPFTPGKTRGGFDCGPGVRQLPWSKYAAPCVPVFNGNNGGATWRGVSADKIRIVFRRYNENADTNAIFSVATGS